jgi:uncharacterized cupin superfamily protein
LVKLTNADTNGAAAIFYQTAPPMSGPRLHRHSREDEWFYVLDGEITVEIDGQRTILHPGGSLSRRAGRRTHLRTLAQDRSDAGDGDARRL